MKSFPINLTLFKIIMLGTAIAAVGNPSRAGAEEYQFDFGVGSESRESSFRRIQLSGDTVIDELIDNGRDTFGISGSWYFSGLNDNDGPLSRAAFVSRASSLSFSASYTKIDFNSLTRFSGPVNEVVTGSGSQQSRGLGVNARIVSRTSGWFGLASFYIENQETDGQNSTSIDRKRALLGVGKYIGDRSAIEFQLISNNDDFVASHTDVKLAFTHLGNIGDLTWGIDAGISTEGLFQEDYVADLGLSLYPRREIEVGVKLLAPLSDPGIDYFGYGAFASWYPSNAFEVYGNVEFVERHLPSFIESSDSSFSLGLRFRF